MGCRECYCKEIVVFLIAGVVWVGLCLFVAHKCGGSCAVMSVSYVEIRYLGEFRSDFGYCIVIVDNPERMSESIGGYEIIFRCSGCRFIDDLLESFIVGKCKEHGFNVGIVDADMLHAVFLAACQLMLFDPLLHIVVNIGCDNYAILCASIHRLGIYVIMLFGILHKPTVGLESVEVLNGFVIDTWIVFIDTRIKIDLRLYDMV